MATSNLVYHSQQKLKNAFVAALNDGKISETLEIDYAIGNQIKIDYLYNINNIDKMRYFMNKIFCFEDHLSVIIILSFLSNCFKKAKKEMSQNYYYPENNNFNSSMEISETFFIYFIVLSLKQVYT